jgi:predicted metal-dependent phosphoesterase TrpH
VHPYLSILPLVAQIGTRTRFRLTTVGDMRRPAAGETIWISVNSVRDFRRNSDFELTVDETGCADFDLVPAIAGEYVVSLYRTAGQWSQPADTRLSFFVVGTELANVYPYKGDLHMHSTYSDGTQSVPYMVAKSREAGMDFIAMTDHRVFKASEEARSWARANKMSMIVFRGEEVNYPLGIGHIVSLNAGRSVSDRFTIHETDSPSDTAEAVRQTELMIEQMRPLYGKDVETMDLPEGADRDLFLWSYGVAQEIRKAGGLAVIAHPYWLARDVRDLVSTTYDAILDAGVFDAVEILNGSGVEGVMLGIAKATEHGWLAGGMPPFVGSSDAHRADMIGRGYTVAFAGELREDAVLQAIRNEQTVACVEAGTGSPIIVGHYHLVEYAYFLVREFFPLHDDLCLSQGGLYKVNQIDSGVTVGPASNALQEHIESLYQSAFAFTTPEASTG